MKITSSFRRAYCLLLFGVLLLLPLLPVQAQKRDHLTEEEADLVREAQVIDKRIEVFIKAADRRLLVLADPNAKQKKKEEEVWGPLPKGTTVELLQDYKKILEEAMEKLDDAYDREKKSDLVVKALKKFKDGAARHIAQLREMAGKMGNKQEQEALAEAIEEAETATKGTTQ